MYPGGRVDISGSVKAYFALKLTGHDPSAEYMQRARAAILAHGGADAVNSFTRFYLALLGQISYDQCPAVPPELVLLPKWFPVNLYAVSSWSRTIIVPLSIISALQPVRRDRAASGASASCSCASRGNWPPLRCPGLTGGTGPAELGPLLPHRRTAVEVVPAAAADAAAAPGHRRGRSAGCSTASQHSDGLGAIYPPIVWSIIALQCLGYDDDSPRCNTATSNWTTW